MPDTDTDRRIDAAHREVAAARPNPRCVARFKRHARALAVPRMAEVMVERLATTGDCTRGDLKRIGCTDADINAYVDEARRIAVLEAARRNLPVGP